MREPTGKECETSAAYEDENVRGFCTWYPQMGGYVGKCVVQPLGGCFEVYVWHDGEFPFEGNSPVELHHCDADQFIRFGALVKEKTCDSSEFVR